MARHFLVSLQDQLEVHMTINERNRNIHPLQQLDELLASLRIYLWMQMNSWKRMQNLPNSLSPRLCQNIISTPRVILPSFAHVPLRCFPIHHFDQLIYQHIQRMRTSKTIFYFSRKSLEPQKKAPRPSQSGINGNNCRG